MARTETVIALQSKISISEVTKRIYTLRGCQVMLDNDLAEIYEVETRMVKRAVKRNPERFPSDFQFELNSDELEVLRSQIGISNVENFSEGRARPCLRSQFGISKLETPEGRGGIRYTPIAFTELGVAMLSTVLRSERAIRVNIGIMRVFVQLRKETSSQLDLDSKLESLESRLMQRFDQLVSQPIPKLHQVAAIQNAVAQHFGLTGEDLKSSSRTQAISLPRQIAIYLARKNLGMGFTQIGLHFGGRDHTSILHAYRKILAQSETNRMIRTTLDSLGNEALFAK